MSSLLRLVYSLVLVGEHLSIKYARFVGEGLLPVGRHKWRTMFVMKEKQAMKFC